MSDANVSLLILAVVVVLFVWNRFPVELVAVGAALMLYFTGVLTLSESLAGFGDPAVLMIAALFVVSEGLDATGVTTWIGRVLAEKSGGSSRRLLVLTMLLSAGLTALIGLNGTVAALLPMVVMVAVRQRYPTSQLLMPLAFAGSAGGMLLLTGSPVNVVVSEAAADAGVGPFGLAEFALVGVPLLAGTVLVVLLFGHRLLPDEASSTVPPDLSRQAAVLVQHYSLDNVFHLRVRRRLRAPRRVPQALEPRRLSGDQGHHRARRGLEPARVGRASSGSATASRWSATRTSRSATPRTHGLRVEAVRDARPTSSARC